MRVSSPSLLRAVLRVGGLVAIGAGMDTALRGARSVPGYHDPADRRLESELRFYGTFYSAYGVAVWRAAGNADRDAASVRAVAGALFAAGTARAIGWRSTGRPSPPQLALLAIELTAPPAVVAWQSRIAGRG